MAFQAGSGSNYPIVACDLDDVKGSPGLPRPESLAAAASRGRRRWTAVTNGPALFLATPSASVGAFGAIEERLTPPKPATVRVISTFHSAMGQQELHQQVLRGRPVVGGRFRVVRSGGGQAVVGGPVGDLDRRKPGRAPKRSDVEVAEAVRSHLSLAPGDPVTTERVVFPMEGTAIWAFRAVATPVDKSVDLRSYVRADDLSLLYAQDVSCAARVFGEASVFRVNPGRAKAPEVVRMADVDAAKGALVNPRVAIRPARGSAFVHRHLDFRLRPEDAGFDEVAAFHHMATACDFFEGLLGPDVFTDKPFLPLQVVVGDRTVRQQVGAFFPGRASVCLADRPSVARAGDVCVHEFTHAVVHRIARLDDEFASPEARGMNEGFADYAQSTIFDDPRFGDWVRDRPDGARRCDDKTLRLPKKPKDPDDRYVVGAAWAATLWDLRVALGAGVADAIAFHALQFLVPGSRYDEARESLHSADAALFSDGGPGRHRTVIDEIIDHRLA